MISVSNGLIDHGNAVSEARLRKSLSAHLTELHPDLLPLLPQQTQEWLLSNMLDRARAFGATWESNLAKLCDMMERTRRLA